MGQGTPHPRGKDQGPHVVQLDRGFEDRPAAFGQVFAQQQTCIREHERKGKVTVFLVDIIEDDKEYIKTELPEVKKEDVKVTVENGVLTIVGERKLEREENRFLRNCLQLPAIGSGKISRVT